MCRGWAESWVTYLLECFLFFGWGAAGDGWHGMGGCGCTAPSFVLFVTGRAIFACMRICKGIRRPPPDTQRARPVFRPCRGVPTRAILNIKE